MESKTKKGKTNKKIPKLIDTENILVVASGGDRTVGEMSGGGQKVQTCSHKVSHGNVIYSLTTIVNSVVHI